MASCETTGVESLTLLTTHMKVSAVLFTKVIDADLHLKAVLGFPVWTNHHAGVVDEDVELRLSFTQKEH